MLRLIYIWSQEGSSFTSLRSFSRKIPTGVLAEYIFSDFYISGAFLIDEIFTTLILPGTGISYSEAVTIITFESLGIKGKIFLRLFIWVTDYSWVSSRSN